MSGTGNSTATVSATGDSAVDGILYWRRWADAEIEYSFPTSDVYTGNYGDGEDSGFFAVTTAMKNATRFVLDTSYGNSANDGFSLEGFTNVSVAESSSNTAHLRLAQTTDGPYNTAWAYLPSTGHAGGDIWFSNSSYDYTNPQVGTYAQFTIIHEIGHALGLTHAHESGSFGPVPSAYDSMEYTVMSYKSYTGQSSNGYRNETYGYAQTWMMLDIAALQHMYGADFTTNSGDTVYSWDPSSGDTLVNGAIGIDAIGNRIFATIWDGGGTDTYDLSAYSTDLSIDLAPGSSSLFSTTQSARLSYESGGIYAPANIYNALQYNGDARSLIENAIGGSGDDAITGNDAANTLTGNDGDDTLLGGDGNDTLSGGDGKDTLKGDRGKDTINGGEGDDYIAGNGGWDKLTAGAGNDVVNGGGGKDTINGEDGNDTLSGGNGDDTISGGAGTDVLNGSKGNDTLLGGSGNDVLRSGDGDDLLIGDGGRDKFFGGAGADSFQFNLASDSAFGGNLDKIFDFEVGIDLIVLSEMVGPTLAFDTTSFSGSGPSVLLQTWATKSRVLVDVDGDAVADFGLLVEGVTNLSVTDFDL